VIRLEPSAHKEILEDVLVLPLFTKVGWLDYFLKLTEYDNEMAKEFAATLWYDEAIVRGLVVDASEMAIAQVIGLSCTGFEYLARVDAATAREELYERGEHLDSTSQGTKRLSLPLFWGKCAYYIIKYFTCDGRHNLLYIVLLSC